MKRYRRAKLAALPILLVQVLAPATAFAHAGGEAGGFIPGFLHPLTGIDHVMAMIAVGMLAATLGGRAVVAVPVAFVVAMAVGGLLGMQGVGLPDVETVIGLSVVVLGMILATGVAMPMEGATGLAAAFALFHGHAHGAEIRAHASGLEFGGGFLIATGLLHGMGLAVGLSGTRAPAFGPVAIRVAGGGMAIAGTALFAGTI